MFSRRVGVFFLTMAVGFAMLIFSHALLGGGRDSFLVKSAKEMASETQAPDPHGKSNH